MKWLVRWYAIDIYLIDSIVLFIMLAPYKLNAFFLICTPHLCCLVSQGDICMPCNTFVESQCNINILLMFMILYLHAKVNKVNFNLMQLMLHRLMLLVKICYKFMLWDLISYVLVLVYIFLVYFIGFGRMDLQEVMT